MPLAPEAVVLLVDDEVLIVRVLCRMLEHPTYTIIGGHTAAAALQAIEKLGRHARVLVTDYFLPDMLGDELERRALRHNPKLRTVYVSGHDLDGTELRDRFVSKPFHYKELRERILKEVQQALTDC